MATSLNMTLHELSCQHSDKLFYVMDDEEFPSRTRDGYRWASPRGKFKWDRENGDYLELNKDKLLWKPDDSPYFLKVDLAWFGGSVTITDTTVSSLFRLSLYGSRLSIDSGHGGTLRLHLADAHITPWTHYDRFGKAIHKASIEVYRIPAGNMFGDFGQGVTLRFNN